MAFITLSSNHIEIQMYSAARLQLCALVLVKSKKLPICICGSFHFLIATNYWYKYLMDKAVSVVTPYPPHYTPGGTPRKI